jgi:class 3 adenylate cyclase/tetratricopeptide (TPR) repeat protein
VAGWSVGAGAADESSAAPSQADPAGVAPADEGEVRSLRPYAPRMLLEWLHEAPEETTRLVAGSVVFADISGFTKLSERLAARGRVGAEELTDAINRCFETLLAVAYEQGASLLKFGGDAMLLLFTGPDHGLRACSAAAAMRQALRDLGAFETSTQKVHLRISLGVHSGDFTTFLVGGSHLELVLTGPAFTTVVDMESTADAGEVVISPATAALLPARAVGRAKGNGFLLARAPESHGRPLAALPQAEHDVVARSLGSAVRAHLEAGVDEPEHRQVTVAFLHFDGTDGRIGEQGAARVAADLDALVRQVQESADKHGVCFLGTDVDHDGGKIILVAGAPTSTGSDEECMLLALREVLETAPSVPIRVGVNTGPVFVGSVGPGYRRTYTVMGDAVNLAARVMSKAVPGQLLATETVLARSATRFETTALEPFLVKGKTAQVQAYDVGTALQADGATRRAAPALVGRDGEIGLLRSLLARAADGRGALVELVGEAGLGKTRLVEELVSGTEGVRVLSTSCAAYQSLTPYFPFRALLRGALGLADGASPAQAGATLLEVLASRAPDLLPWAPLLAIPLGAEVPGTPEVDQLDERFVKARLHDVVTLFLGVVLDTPTLVAVEDVHWSDDASAELLQRVARDVEHGPWFICVTRRDDGTGFVADQSAQVVTLALTPLAEDSSLALAEDLADSEPGAQHLSPHDLTGLVSRSGGNPLLLTELVAGAAAAGGVEELPGTVEALVMARIDRLSPMDRALLRRLSVFGQSCDHALLVATLGAEAPTRDDAVWGRLQELVRFADDTLRFEHALVRDCAYGSLPFRLRQALHAQIGATVEARAEEPEAVASLLSLHYFNAHRYDAAWRFSRTAADRARAAFANVEAVELYERAAASARLGADVPAADLAAVHEAAGDLHSRLGKFTQADLAYRSARPWVADTESQVRLMLRRGELRQRFGHYPAALRWLGKARRLARSVDEEAGHQLLGRISLAFAAVAKDQGRHRDAITWCRRAIAVAGPIWDKATLANAYSVHDGSASVLGRLDEARFGDRALALFTELGDLRGQGQAHSNLGLLSIMQGRWDDGLAHWEQSKAALRAVGDEVNVAIISANLAEARLEQGRLEEAERHVRQAARVWAAAGDRASSAYAARLLARVEARRGDVDDALERFARARADFEAVQAEDEVLETSVRVAEALVLAGRTQQALAWCTELLEGSQDLGQFQGLLHRLHGFAHAQGGDRGRARACFALSLAAAEDMGAEIEVAQTLHALARLDEGTETTAQHARRCRELFEALGVVAPAEPPLVGAPIASA